MFVEILEETANRGKGNQIGLLRGIILMCKNYFEQR